MSMIDEALTKLMDDEISAAEYVAVVKRSVREQAVNERGVRHKHFTDAELAAECWRAERDWALLSREAPVVWIGQWAHDKFGAHARAQTLHRFATTPHYFEEAA